MPSFNTKLQRASVTVNIKAQQEEFESNLRHKEWEARKAQELHALQMRTKDKLQVLHSLGPWLQQGRRLKQLKRSSAKSHEVLSIYLTRQRHTACFCIDSRGMWGRILPFKSEPYQPESSELFLQTLDAVSYDDIAHAIAELAREHGWELPDIDLDVPDEPATAAPTTKATLKTHPKWTAIFRARKEQHLSKES